MKLSKLTTDRKGSVEGLPLQFMIMMIVAVAAVGILSGWMAGIETPRSIGDVEVLSAEGLADPDGNIDFPVLGSLHVEGKTLKQVKKEIADEITGRGYIREPVVKADLEKMPNVIMLDIEQKAKDNGVPRSANVILLGAAQKALGIEYKKLEDAIRRVFGRKGDAIVEANIKALAIGAANS